MAKPSSFDVPAELRALVDFIHTDNRPTAILSKHGSVVERDARSHTIYRNPAFKRLGLEHFELELLLTQLADRTQNGENATNSFVDGADGRSWRLRHVGEQWNALVCSDTLQVFRDTSADPESDEGYRSSSGNSEQASTSEQGNAGEDEWAKPGDWTRFEVSGVSGWVGLVRAFDWSSTGVGPMDKWSGMLRGYTLHIMSNPNPRVLIWGNSRTFIYNEACIPLFGDRHPDCLGKTAPETWAEIWDEIGPFVENSFHGKVNKLERMPLAMHRHGFLEETYWDFTMLPITGSEGQVVGLLQEITETTKIVTGERRKASVAKMSEQIASASSLPDLWSSYLQGLESAVEDVPFTFLYAVVDDVPDAASENPEHDHHSVTAKKCVLAGSVGVAKNNPAVHETFGLLEHIETGPGIIKSCLQAWRSRKPVTLRRDDGTLPAPLTAAVAGRGFGGEIHMAMVSPITSIAGGDVLAILVTALNPRAPFDPEYSLYAHFQADILIKAASLISLPLEQRRTQKIADDMNSALAHQLRLTTLQAERREARFLRMAAEAPTGMFACDIDGRPLYVNDAYLHLLGETKDQHAAGISSAMAWKDLVHPDDEQRFVEAWHRVVEQKAPVTIEHRLRKPWVSIDKASGQEISGETWLLANAFPDVDTDGVVSSIQGWLTDISHRKFTEKLLARKLEDALENKRQSENFIDMTSHEMRNPLSAMLQSADTIVSTLASAGRPSLDKPLSLTHDYVEEIFDAAQTIILCAQHQKRIVDDILTLSKLDASLLVISPDKVQPPMLVNKALKMYESEIARAGITVKVNIESSYHELGLDWVVLDPSRLLQVVINLLTNAVKFTQYSHTREITISLGASYDQPTGKHHGVDFIPTIHSKPAHTPLSEWGDGEMIYLQIAVADTGRGLSEDEMKVLFQRFSQASPKTYKQYGGSGLGLFISRELCELQGGQIGVSSANGITTFTFFVQAKKWITDDSPQKARRPTLPRFTSASASPMAFSRRGSEVLKEATLGAQEPLKRVSSVSEADENPIDGPVTNGDRSIRERDARKDETQLHVLIVEDNLINQKVTSQQLRRAGCIVHVANHGLECLNFLEQTIYCSEATPLSVVLLDLEMPTMDGLTCIRHIREQQLSGKIIGHIPVIAVTANARSEQISIAIEAGMDSVVTKPFRIPELVPQMHALVAEIAERNDGG